jgi:hypothetical protein
MSEEPYQVTERGDPRDRIANQRPYEYGRQEMTTETTEMLQVLTSEDIEAIAGMRKLLDGVEERAVKAAWATEQALAAAGRVDYKAAPSHNWGRLAEACDITEAALFNVLNLASSHCKVEEAGEALRRELEGPEEEATESPEMLRDVHAGIADDEPDYLHDTRGEHDPRL